MTQEQAAQIADNSGVVYCIIDRKIREAQVVWYADAGEWANEVDGRLYQMTTAYATSTEAEDALAAIVAEAARRREYAEQQRKAAAESRKRRARAPHSHRWEWLSHEEKRCTVCGRVEFVEDN